MLLIRILSAAELGQSATLGCVCFLKKGREKNKSVNFTWWEGENLSVVGRREIIIVQRTLSKLELMRGGWTVSRIR